MLHRQSKERWREEDEKLNKRIKKKQQKKKQEELKVDVEAKDHCWSNNPGTEKRKNAKEKATGEKVEEEAEKPWRYRSTEKA